MSEIVTVALIGGLSRIIEKLIDCYEQTRKGKAQSSQVGAVGEEEVKNQVSPRPPVGN
jgi:hypothetical protein